MDNALNPQYATPGLPRRFAAMVYDTLLLMAISILYGFIAMAINVAFKGVPEPGHRATFGAAGPLVFILWILVLVGFYSYFWHRAGQTLGMRTWRMKVLSAEGGFPSYRQSLIRCATAVLSFLCLGLGYWWMLWDSERQTLHDKASGTRTYLVAKEKRLL